jgi:quercetin dioxygenase-like cupin family protein
MEADMTRQRMCIVLAGALGLAVVVGGQARAGKKAAAAAVLTPTTDVKWNAVPGMDGIMLAVVEGDPAKGAHHSFMRFTGGFAAPEHHHSADHFVTVIAGTLVLTVDGKATEFPAGSYFAFTGKKPHATACKAGAECVLFIDARGKWDVVPEKK